MRNIQTARRTPIVSLTLLCLLSFSPGAHADDALGEVLAAMVKLKMIDPAFQDAKEMLGCLVANNGDAGACFNIPTAAEKQAGKAAGMFMPDDPKIQGVVDIVIAVQNKRWLVVVEIAGIDILVPLICENTARVAGPVGSWFCSDPFRKVVAKKAKPVVKEVFRLLNGGSLSLGKLFELVALLADLDLACGLVPQSVDGVHEACSLLGKIIAEIGGLFVDAAEYGADIVVSTADDVENIIFGSDAHMPYDKYYALYWLPWLHKSVNLCVTGNCAGTGQLNEKIWSSCVDYFDAHNQYRDTAKKTCDDMRDKRYHKAYELLARAIVDGARSYILTIRAGAKAWAITEYGKNSDAGIRAHFLTLCETELEQGYPLTTGHPAMCEAYKHGTGLAGAIFAKYYPMCVAQVAAQQVAPTAWHNACKKAEPDFVLMFQAEKKALQENLTALASEACAPPQGWNAQQGLRLQCQTYSGYDHCRKVMVVGANSICGIDRSKADAARAKEIHAFLGAMRCSLAGNEISCRRPWKHAQCQQLVKSTASIEVSKSALSCVQDLRLYNSIVFANQNLLNELNRPISRGGQGPGCSLREDQAKISCQRVNLLQERLAAKPAMQRPLCQPDPDYNGSDVGCFLIPYNMHTAPQPATASMAPAATSMQQPGNRTLTRDTAMQPAAGGTGQAANQAAALPGTADANVPATVFASPATRAMIARQPAADAPPNPCDYEATYYEPLPPVIETSSSNYQVGDQIQIRCSFEKRTKKIVWPQCDDFAKNAKQVMQYGAESGSRYSGLFVVDGATIGVASSPLDGDNFASAGLWTFNEAGVHVVSCLVDNGLRPAEKDGAVYLESRVEVTVVSADGAATMRRFQPEAARRVPVRELPDEPVRQEPKP